MQSSGASPRTVVATIMREVGGSGVQTHVRAIAEQADMMGREVSVVTPFTARSRSRTPVFAVRRLIEPLSRPASVRWYRHWHGVYLAAGLRERLPDRSIGAVVYAQCPVSAAAALDVRTDQPVAMAVHFNLSQADEWAGKGDIPFGGTVFESIRAFEADLLPRLDGIVYVSEFIRRAVLERIPNLVSVPSVVIPNFLEVAATRVSSPTHDLVTLGALEPRKNQAFILEVVASAVARGHSYRLTVIGDGPDRGRLERQADALGIADLVTFVGHHPNPREILRRHRLYCHAAVMESFGIAITEAMAEGVPVVIAPIGGAGELIRPGVEGETWDLADSGKAADLVISLMEDPERLAAMGARALDCARTRFAAGTQAPRLLDFLGGLTMRTP